MKRFFLITFALGIAGTAFSQRITAVHPDPTGEKIIIEYDRLPGGSPVVEIREGNNGWHPLESLTQGGEGQFVWDLFGEYPLGVTDASFRLTGFSIDDIPQTNIPYAVNKRLLDKGSVLGHNYYYVTKDRTSQWNQGKWRKGAVFTYVDDVRITGDVYIYDFLTDKWEGKINADSWEGRVPRQTCNGVFEKPYIPPFTVTETPEGVVKLNDKVVVSPDEATDPGLLRGVTIQPVFSVYARNYVAGKIAPWEKRGEYEKTADYEARIAQEREGRVKQLTEDARNAYISALAPQNIREQMSISNYSADDEYFVIHSPYYGEIHLNVPISDAEKFKKDWHKVKVTAHHDVVDDRFATTLIEFRLGKKNYQYTPSVK